MNKAWLGTLKRVTGYLFVRLLTISLTIFVGVFLTLLIVNRSGAVDDSVMEKLEAEFKQIEHSDYGASLQPEEWEALQAQMIDDAGLNLAYPTRTLR